MDADANHRCEAGRLRFNGASRRTFKNASRTLPAERPVLGVALSFHVWRAACTRPRAATPRIKHNAQRRPAVRTPIIPPRPLRKGAVPARVCARARVRVCVCMCQARKRRNCNARQQRGRERSLDVTEVAQVCKLLRQIYFARLFALLNILPSLSSVTWRFFVRSARN